MPRFLSLRHRVSMLALLPTLTISLLLGTTFTLTRLQDLEQSLQERATLVSEQLAPLAAQVLQQNSRDLEQQILRRALEQPDVRAARLYDSEGTLIGHSGPQMHGEEVAEQRGLTEETHLLEQNESFRILRPLVSYSGFFRERAALPQQLDPKVRQRIGWLEIEFSRDNNQIKVYQTFLASGLLIQAGILLNLLLAMSLGRKITQPLQEIISAVRQMRDGDLDTRIPLRGGNELAQLSEDINAMADSIQASQRELTEEMEQATADLKETLDTLEISNHELRLARKKAQDANRTKSEFLANMSHELRTPLNSMLGFAKLLQRSELGEHQQDYLGTIRASGEGLLTMLNSILDFSKLEAGKLELDHSPFNLRDLVEQVLVLMAPAAHEKNLELIPLIYTDVPLQLAGDPLRLKQILTNLLGNAVKFTEHGSICVRVMLEEEQGARRLLKISISDTGIGIAPQQISRLFEAFAQVDSSVNRQLGGTGLGLMISKGLAEKMGGEIGVESELGSGSTFWFSFWADQSQQQIGIQPLQLPKTRALLYEPYPLARSSYLNQLQLHGISVEECQDFQRLQQELGYRCEELDLVILSYHPQSLDSSQIEQLLQMIDGHCARFIILCGTKEESALVRLLAPYPNSLCLVKPLSLQPLNRALKHLLISAAPAEHHLPAATHSPKEPAAVARPATSSSAPHILAVDDNAANLKLVRVLLQELGAQVDTAAGGEEALELAAERSYDLILMDIQMPDLDGLTVTRRLREKPGLNQHSPIIALTAHALAHEKRQLLLAGMDAYLTKPIDELQLKQVIERWSGCTLQEIAPAQPALLPGPASAQTETGTRTDTQPALPLVDTALGIRLAGGKPQLAEELLQMLLQALPEERQKISAALHAQDWATLLERVHKQHGASRYCGVPRLQQACQQAEEALKDRGCPPAQQKQRVERLLAELDALNHWQAKQAG